MYRNCFILLKILICYTSSVFYIYYYRFKRSRTAAGKIGRIGRQKGGELTGSSQMLQMAQQTTCLDCLILDTGSRKGNVQNY
jgi:hypothetical protein